MQTSSMNPLRALSSIWRSSPRTRPSQCQATAQQTASFSSTQSRLKRNKGRQRPDQRITLIRYFLDHPITPRPLRFSRNRALRHWTIDRAWKLYQNKLRQARELNLDRQFQSMASACEALRLIDGHGLTTEERERLGEAPRIGEEKEMGRLYRIAMLKNDIWKGVPIEYARIQTDSPGREPWNHAWTR